MDFDHAGWTYPEDEVQPSEDLADLYKEGFDRYLTHPRGDPRAVGRALRRLAIQLSDQG